MNTNNKIIFPLKFPLEGEYCLISVDTLGKYGNYSNYIYESWKNIKYI